MAFVPILVALAALVLYLGLQQIKRANTLKQLAKQHGCQPIFKYRNKLPLGLDRKYQLLTYKGNALDDLVAKRFLDIGRFTYTDDIWGLPPLFTADPENIKAILAVDFDKWGMEKTRIPALGPWLGSGIFISSPDWGSLWGVSRALMRPSFAQEGIYSPDVLEDSVQDLLKTLGKDNQGWTTLENLSDVLRRFTMDVVTEQFCGGNVRSQGRKETLQLETAFDEVNTKAISRIRVGAAFCWLYDTAAFKAACATFDKFGYDRVDRAIKMVREKESRQEEERDFIRSMATRTEDRKLMRDLVVQSLFAGLDTTHSLFSFLFVELARTPGAWDRLRKELSDEGLLDAAPADLTRVKLKSCTFLQNAITETLRLYPSIPMNARQAVKDTVLPVGGGPDGTAPIVVAKGTIARYSVYVMQRRTDLYGPDAHEWNPDRWIGRKQGWEYLPFNGGPRICIGQKFALTETAYMLARIVQTFDRVDTQVPQGKLDVVAPTALFPMAGVPIRLHHSQA